MTTPGWAFLVARGYETGYQLLLAPDFVLTGREAGLLLNAVRCEVPDTAPPRTVTVSAPSSGPLTLVYRTLQLARTHDGQPYRDRAGRPLVLAYGFLCRGVRVTWPDEQDLEAARNQAVETYQRFQAAEMEFVPEAAQAYPVRSTVAPVEAAPPAPAPAAGAWTADALPTRTRPARSPGRGMSVLAALLAALLLTVGYLAFRGVAEEPKATVAVPAVVGQPLADAQRQVTEAGLRVIETIADQGTRPVGTVTRTDPVPGVQVTRGSGVRLWVSTGRPAAPGTAPRTSRDSRGTAVSRRRSAAGPGSTGS